MSAINDSPIRVGNFTSSNIYKLMTVSKSGTDFGVPAITYIHEKNLERKLGISLATEINAKELSWGNLNEDRAFNLMGIDYTLSSTMTDTHPTIPFWRGSKDGTKEVANRAVIDFKCPFTRKSFCGLVMPLYCGLTGMEAMKAIRNGFKHEVEGKEPEKYPPHPDGDKYYWQLVSNAILNNCNHAELIIYMPYQSELLEIGEAAKEIEACKWMMYAPGEVPFIPDNGYFKNLNVISFEIPQEDKDLLTATILKAGKMLIEYPVQLNTAA